MQQLKYKNITACLRHGMILHKRLMLKTIQTKSLHRLPDISCNERGIELEGGGVLHICLVGCKLPPVNGYQCDQ